MVGLFKLYTVGHVGGANILSIGYVVGLFELYKYTVYSNYAITYLDSTNMPSIRYVVG